MKRRTLLQGMMLGALLPGAALQLAAQPLIEVYLNPSCGCCGAWVNHLSENGFTVKVTQVEDTGEYRTKFKMPEKYGSCHTAMVGGYAIEGHVPAREIKRLLKEKPKAIGLAVPDMPMGSPGMEGPHSDAYDVLLIDAKGGSRVYAHYPMRKTA